MKSYLYLIAILFLVISCTASRKTKQEEKTDLRPDWVKQRPVVSGEYIGIGMSVKSYGADFRESARKNALADMSSQIEVNISVNSLLHTISTDTRYQQEFRSLTKTTTQLQLEGYEIAGTWESPTEYWMYYRMPVSAYQESRRNRIQAARAQSLDLLRKGDELKRTGAVPAAMGYYTRALDQLKPFLNESLQADYDGKQIFLANEILKSINESIRNLSFKVDPGKIQVVTSKGINVPIRIEVRFNEGGFPIVPGLPIKADFTKGDGVLAGTLVTNPSGICELRLTGLATADAAQEIVIKPDIEKMMVKEPSSKIWFNMADTRQAPIVPLPLQVMTPLVFVDTKESNLDQTLPSPRMAPFIQQELSRSGIRFTEDLAAADFILTIQSSTKALGEFNGMFSAGLNAEIRLSDVRTRQAMTTQVLADIRGVQLNYIRAGEDAYFKAESELRRRVVPALNKVLLGR
jgi:hypothetical protein